MITLNFPIDLNPHGSPRKAKRTEDKRYLKFFAERNPFCFCGKPSQLHHAIGGRSRNSKCSDFLVVNLCAEHHAEIGSNEIFQKKHNVSFSRIIEKNLRAYADHLGISGAFDSFQELEETFINHRRRAA